MDELDRHTEEFLYLADLVVHHRQTWLTNMSDDPCETRNYSTDCNAPCVQYRSKSFEDKCVNGQRVTDYNTPGLIWNGRNGIDYEVVVSKEPCDLELIYGGTYYAIRVDIYYRIMLSKDSNNVFILFSSGNTFRTYVEDDEDVNTWIRKLMQYVQEMAQKEEFSTSKFIFCGHSMGSAFALCAAKKLQETSPKFFATKCFAVETGPIPWMTKKSDETTFYNLNNIRVYIRSELEKTYKELHQDTSKDSEPEWLHKYLPNVFISREGHVFDGTEYKIKIGVKEFGPYGKEENIHLFKGYFDAISNLFLNKRAKRRGGLTREELGRLQGDLKKGLKEGGMSSTAGINSAIKDQEETMVDLEFQRILEEDQSVKSKAVRIGGLNREDSYKET